MAQSCGPETAASVTAMETRAADIVLDDRMGLQASHQDARRAVRMGCRGVHQHRVVAQNHVLAGPEMQPIYAGV